MGVYFDNGHEAVLGRTSSAPVTAETMRPLMRMVYMWMTFGLALTGVIAAIVSSQLYTQITAGNIQLLQSLSSAMFPLLLIELAVVFGLSWGINRISPAVA